MIKILLSIFLISVFAQFGLTRPALETWESKVEAGEFLIETAKEIVKDQAQQFGQEMKDGVQKCGKLPSQINYQQGYKCGKSLRLFTDHVRETGDVVKTIGEGIRDYIFKPKDGEEEDDSESDDSFKK